jgi:hypothetical protein
MFLAYAIGFGITIVMLVSFAGAVAFTVST